MKRDLLKLVMASLALLSVAIIPVHRADAQFPAELPGIEGGDGTVGVTAYYLGGVIDVAAPIENQIITLEDIVSGGIEPFEIASDSFPTLALDDPTSLGGGQIQPKFELPGGGGDDYIVTARGAFQVTDPGIYTFNIQSDDGFGMRIAGLEPIDNINGEILDGAIQFPGDTGNSNTTVTYDLPVGTHRLEYMFWENGGGAFAEVATAKGDFINNSDAQPQYLALGDGSTLAENTVFPGTGVGVLTRPLNILNLNNVPDFEQPLEFAREYLFDNIDAPDAELDDGEVFVIDDHNLAPAGCPFGVFNHDGNVVQWPNTAGNVDNFISHITGAFTVDDGDDEQGETMEFTFHVDSDDRSYFRIIGQDFEDIDAQEIVEIEGDDSMWGDANTCNTNYSGLITLTEGEEYEFEALHVEAGGDSGMQVLAAAGDFLFDPDPDAFTPLALAGGEGTLFAANTGLPFVDPAGGLPGDYNGNGELDVADLNLQAAGIQAGDATFDLNGDGTADFADRQVWVQDLKKTWIGDANLDGEFNSSDFVAVFQAGLFETGNPAGWGEGDWNADGVFNSSDFVSAFQGGGFEQGVRPAAVSAVPEPSSLLLLALSLLGLCGVRRK